MPKTAFDYKNSVIYKICCKDHNIKDIYIGSTTNMVQRRYVHKSNCNNENKKEHNIYVYEFIREHGGWDNWEMVLVDKYPCVDNMELQQRERYWYDELKPSLNTLKPHRNKEDTKESSKKYYEGNKDKIKDKNKKYREENRDKRSENQKRYYEENKERLNKKITCECGGKYTSHHKSTHNKTKKHRLYVEKQLHLNSVKIGEI
jgi:Mg-chelatase subunit ChlI